VPIPAKAPAVAPAFRNARREKDDINMPPFRAS
jgi:hypothetical protein